MYDVSQPTPVAPSQPPAGVTTPLAAKPRWSRLRNLKIPLVAQITGALSLILLVAGLLTARELSQNSQDLSSMAQSAPGMDLSITPATHTIGVNQEATFNVEINPNGRQPTAAHLILKYDPTFVSIHKGNYVAPFTNILHDLDPGNGQTVVAVGTVPTTILNTRGNLLTFTVTAKDKKGTTKVTLEGSEAAAAGYTTNQGRIAGDLTLTIGDAPPTGTICWNNVVGNGQELNWPNSCKGNPPDPEIACTAGNIPLTAAEKTQYQAWQQAGSVIPDACKTPPVSGGSCVSKTANVGTDAKVTRGQTIEYTITVKPQSDTAYVVVKDTLPAHVEYVPGSLELNNDGFDTGTSPITGNQLSVMFGLGPNRRAENHTFSYKVKVKADAPLTAFTNSAQIFFKTSETATEAGTGSCSKTLTVSEAPSATGPKLNLMFRVQGVTKAGITKEAEISIRYKHKSTGEMIVKKFTHSFTSTVATSPDTSPAGTFRSAELITLTDLNMSEVDSSTTSYPTFGTGIEVFVKTPTSLRKKLGELTYQSNQPPVTLQGIFIGNDQRLIIGDYDRSSAEQINVLRNSDVGKMLSVFSDISHPITGPTDPKAAFDIDNNNVLNSGDLSLLLSNLKGLSVTGDTP